MQQADCYRPYFTYAKDGLTAKQIVERWARLFRFLPETSCEPERIAAWIQRQEREQLHTLRIEIPNCPVHKLRMVMLGKLGIHYTRCHRRLKFHEADKAHGGMIPVAKGIFRCPHPGCVYVAPVETKAEDLGKIRCNKGL
jgi:hypothetical protein